MIIGVILAVVIGGFFIFGSIVAIFLPEESTDPEDVSYNLISVCWGTPVSSSDLWIYQIQVFATDTDHDGVYDVSAKACIGSSSYFHDFGSLGTASSRGEAVKNYGDIIWHDDRVTIGGESGIKTTLLRSDLEKHR